MAPLLKQAAEIIVVKVGNEPGMAAFLSAHKDSPLIRAIEARVEKAMQKLGCMADQRGREYVKKRIDMKEAASIEAHMQLLDGLIRRLPLKREAEAEAILGLLAKSSEFPDPKESMPEIEYRRLVRVMNIAVTMEMDIPAPLMSISHDAKNLGEMGELLEKAVAQTISR